MIEGFSPDNWLNLGIGGAALFIILVVVVLIFKMQGKSTDKLCDRIDSLITIFADQTVNLNKVLISNDKDQKEMIRQLDSMCLTMNDMHQRVVRIDARLYTNDDIKFYKQGGTQDAKTTKLQTV